ncbi:MAG: hypothetical protein C0508_10705 [Cyanobacteria bacterium PR.023]|nr:hypothetical protein [Cyanobacteria bacterium PR.023]
MATFAELLNPVHSPEKKKVLEAIATRGPRIVPVDIAADTGMALPLVVSELNNIASETNAHLEVTESGNIAYKFAGNLQQAYAANASREVLRSIFRVIANVSLIVMRAFVALMFFIVRISFGLALVLGALLVVVLVVVVIIAGLKALTGGDSDSGGGDFNFDFGNIFDFGYNSGYSYRPAYLYWMFDWFWDWIFFWRYVTPMPVGYGSSNLPYDAQGDYRNQRNADKATPNFLFSVFSYLFGDGSPNKNFEESKWQTIAQVLEANQGVVTAEQIAPFTGLDPKNEDWMIGVMQRFNGSPEVTEAGHIIYVFPAFQSLSQQQPNTALGSAKQEDFAPDNLSQLFNQHIGRQKAIKTSQSRGLALEGFLPEKEWQFMSVEGGQLFGIIAFGLVVLLGSIFLIFNMSLVPVLYTLQPLLYILFGYGLLFFLIPALRFPIFRLINDGIIERNDKKMAFAVALKNPTPELNDKLLEARKVRFSGLPKGPDNTIYTTEKDALDQPDDLDDKFKKLEG